jgi:hypothetical protein
VLYSNLRGVLLENGVELERALVLTQLDVVRIKMEATSQGTFRHAKSACKQRVTYPFSASSLSLNGRTRTNTEMLSALDVAPTNYL